MERQTILILDGQLHRGGILEQGLNHRGFNVFRTSRSREAAKLLQVLQPKIMVLAWEGEGKEFYVQRVLSGKVGWTTCIVLAPTAVADLREQDRSIPMELQSTELIDAVASEVAMLVGSSTGGVAVASSRTRTAVPASHGGQNTPVAPSFSPASTVPPSSAPSERRFQTPLPLGATEGQGSTSAYPQFTGDSGRKRDWRGSLDKLDIARLFSILMRRQASGQLILTQREEVRTIWLHGGTLLSAESNMPLHQVPQMLVQDGVIQSHQVGQFPELSRPRPGYRLNELGLIQNNQIETFNRLYIEQVVLTSFIWERGTFQVTSSLDEKSSRPGGLELSPLIIQGVREGYSLDRLLKLLGGEDRVPQWFAHRSPENYLPLNTLEKRVLQQIDGARSLRELHTQLQIDPRVPFGLIYVLMILGFVTLQEPATATPSDSRGGHLREMAGESTPEAPLVSARQMGDAVKSAPTPRSMPSLDPQASMRNPTASYRFMQSGRVSARPALQRPTLDSAPDAHTSPTQDQAAFNQIQTKYHEVTTVDYFKILEISTTAGDMEIRRAYQRLKHTFSPQQYPSNLPPQINEQLDDIQQTIQDAYDVLGDPNLREHYRRNLDAF